ncbi:MAG: peptide ABC transporter substrate-binding protein [Bdellovibrio sp.]|nr:MAG: peptide ABC transporter substrate-binding protein [Bdellovibrio sp.]
MIHDPDTYELTPWLADDLKKDPKGLWYIFHIRKNVFWHDGKPLTAKDVKFSFDVIRDDRFATAHLRPYYENIKECILLDDHTVKFTVKKKYFGNLNVLATLQVAPQHVYGDPKKKVNKKIIGSGPYILAKYHRGKSIILKRNPKWWGNHLPEFKGQFNFQKIFIRFIKNENVRLEMLKKGQLDYLSLTPEAFVKKTEGAIWTQKIDKIKAENLAPKSYGFVGWNLKKPLFQDRKVRLALSHLMNREEMNKKFRYNMSLLATGPWYRQSVYADPQVKPLLFNPQKAAQLLSEAGWKDSDKDGLLDKKINGQKTPFRFTLMFANKDSEKYFTMYKEDLRKAGIEMNIKLVEWNTLVKALDEKKFDAVNLGWGGGSVDLDPKQIWHSQSAKNGGSNFISYSNKEVDRLIDLGRQELDKKKRIKIFRKVYRLIAQDAPYTFMFVNKYVLYAKSKRVKQQKPTYKYEIGEQFWWMEP